MGILSEMRDYWVNSRDSFVIPCPSEKKRETCTDVRIRAGFEAATWSICFFCVPLMLENVMGSHSVKLNPIHISMALTASAAVSAGYFIHAERKCSDLRARE